jgi:hypothetical protein
MPLRSYKHFSPVPEQLRALAAKGVEPILCSTCPDYFGLTERVAVGIVGGIGLV